MKHASPIYLRLCFPLVVLSVQALLLIEGLSGPGTSLAGQGQKQESVLSIFCSGMKNLVQISPKQGQSAHRFFTKTVLPCIAHKFC